jgi:hypothetical protein
MSNLPTVGILDLDLHEHNNRLALTTRARASKLPA